MKKQPKLASLTEGVSIRPITVNVQQACAISGLGQSTIYKFVREGRLRLIRVGRRSLISYSDLEKLCIGDP